LAGSQRLRQLSPFEMNVQRTVSLRFRRGRSLWSYTQTNHLFTLEKTCMYRKITLVLFAASLLALTFFRPVTAQKTDEQSARMQRIETGLLPAVVIKGHTQPTRLTEQMAKYKVPGVSIAVINNGKLE
jgi:hypothetical protein